MQSIRETAYQPAKPPSAAHEAVRTELVRARVPQGYETNIRIRIVPGRDIDIGQARVGCVPRKGAPRREARPLDLPPDLVARLKDADKAVVAWLAQDPANARLFMARPTEALARAGVELSRAEQKAIDRSHRAVREAAVVAPGVKVASMTVAAFPGGRVGRIPPVAKPGDSQGGEGRGDTRGGCAKEE